MQARTVWPVTPPDHLVDDIRAAAGRVREARFVELLRWHRVFDRLPDLEWGTQGSYLLGVRQLSQERAVELLADLRREGRDWRSARRGADGKPRFRGGLTLRELAAGDRGQQAGTRPREE